jgi:hypothetical protein
MMRLFTKLFFSALFLVCVQSGFAIDGQILINQSTVMASGGFPYRITQPGSYKLSGNLTAPLNVSAIKFDTSNVTLDLGGFTINCNFNQNAAFFQGCLTDANIPQRALTVRNGSINLTATAPSSNFSYFVGGIVLVYSTGSTLEDLRISGTASNFSMSGFAGGKYFIIRNNVLSGSAGPSVSCPSSVNGNVNGTLGAGSTGSGCVGSGNVGFIPF